MIFVTVGGQLPFDRLIRVVDEWAGRSGRSDLFAQVGPGGFATENMPACELISPRECRDYMNEAEVIVAHAGMGTILTALDLKKPLLVMPRLARLSEHRNDHQVATARYFAKTGHVQAAFDEDELRSRLDHLHEIEIPESFESKPSEQLLERIRHFALGDG